MDDFEQIEFTASDRNIIRFCVEKCYKQNLEQGDNTRAEIAKAVYDKLKKLRDKELKNGTSEESLYL